MLVGIASGTYSSIFIASPVLNAWKEREPAYRRRRARIEQIEGTVPAFADDIEVAKLSTDEETDEQIEAAIAAKRRGEDGDGAAVLTEAPSRRRRRSRPRPSLRRRWPSPQGPTAPRGDGRAGARVRTRGRPSGRPAGSAASNDAAGAASTGGIDRWPSSSGSRWESRSGTSPCSSRSLLAGDHRRLPRGDDRRRRLRRDRQVGQRQGPRRHRHRHRAAGDPRHGHRARPWSTRSASASSGSSPS